MPAVRFTVPIEQAIGTIEWGRVWGVACTRVHRSADNQITIHASSPQEGRALAFARQCVVHDRMIVRVPSQGQEVSC